MTDEIVIDETDDALDLIEIAKRIKSAKED